MSRYTKQIPLSAAITADLRRLARERRREAVRRFLRRDAPLVFALAAIGTAALVQLWKGFV